MLDCRKDEEIHGSALHVDRAPAANRFGPI